MHPKTNLLPRPEAIQQILKAGWVGQLKIHGHRAQIHIPADSDKEVLAFNRQGKLHKLELPELMEKELRRLFSPRKDWNVIDAEWLKPQKKLFVFDFIKKEGSLLRDLTYPDRYKLIPKDFISPALSVLPLIEDMQGCLKALESTKDYVEGLVFKSTTSPGFRDTSIVRCRKR